MESDIAFSDTQEMEDEGVKHRNLIRIVILSLLFTMAFWGVYYWGGSLIVYTWDKHDFADKQCEWLFDNLPVFWAGPFIKRNGYWPSESGEGKAYYLIQALKYKNRMTRITAGYHCYPDITPPTKELISALEENLSDPDKEVCLAAMDALRQINEVELGELQLQVNQIMIRVFENPDPGFRCGAIDSFSYKNEEIPNILPALLKTLKDSDKWVRMGTLELLGRYYPDSEEIVPSIIKLLNDPEPEVIHDALAALHRIGIESRSAIPELIRILRTSKFPELRMGAIGVMQRLGPFAAPAVNALLETIKEEVPEEDESEIYNFIQITGDYFKCLDILTLKYHSIGALGTIGKPAEKAVPFLLTLLTKLHFKYDVAIALSNMGVRTEEVKNALWREYMFHKDDKREQRYMMIDSQNPGDASLFALGRLFPDDPEVIQELENTQNKRDEWFKVAAKFLLAKRGGLNKENASETLTHIAYEDVWENLSRLTTGLNDTDLILLVEDALTRCNDPEKADTVRYFLKFAVEAKKAKELWKKQNDK